MEVTSVVLAMLVSLIIGILILYAVFSLRPSVTYSLASGTGAKNGSLASPTYIGVPQNVYDGFFKTPGGTISLYLYVGGRFPNNDAKLLSISDSLEFAMLSGGNGNSPETVLSIKQVTYQADQVYKIKCANFPIQQWVHVTIVREGRRFTVFYNGKVAADERTYGNIVPVVSTMTIGSEGLPGEWAHVNLTPYAYRLENIKDEMSKSSDTRHVPYITPTMNFNVFSCPNGLFCFNANTSQESTLSPLRRWQTPYA
jgi:hypothetical protein